MAITVETTYAPIRIEDLLDPIWEDKLIEIIEGELIVVNSPHWKHNKIAYRVTALFDRFCIDHTDFDFLGDQASYLLQRNPNVMLRPDATLFRKCALPDTFYMEFPPTVAVEILSPSNSDAEMAYKRQMYFKAGAEQVWLIDHVTKKIEFWFRDGRKVVAQGNEVVICEGVVSGMKIDLIRLMDFE